MGGCFPISSTCLEMPRKAMISTLLGFFERTIFSAERMFATQYVVVWCVVEGTGGRNVENGGLNAQKYTVFI
jgi:hypothetical protein